MQPTKLGDGAADRIMQARAFMGRIAVAPCHIDRRRGRFMRDRGITDRNAGRDRLTFKPDFTWPPPTRGAAFSRLHQSRPGPA
ncbi:hypothetical protein AA0614_0400 [Komagataeibacter saccharivorans NRIC 0614]|nr:hypothetical protein AA0614_0400 [Komagataeibacter saccharivorans NRIC 0614]